MLAARGGGLHSGADALAGQRRFQLRHGGDDREHGAAHGAGRVDLGLNADEPHAEMVELREPSAGGARNPRRKCVSMNSEVNRPISTC